MINRIGFRLKMYLAVVIVLLIAMATSFVSVNYFVSDYIYQSDSQNIANSTALVESNIATNIQAKIDLARNLSVSVVTIIDVENGTEFFNIYKVIQGLVFDSTGSVDDQAVTARFLEIAQQVKDDVLISDVEQRDGKKVIYIAVKQPDDSVNIFYVDLDFIPALVEKSETKGSYLEIRDGKDTLIYSNKAEGDLIEQSSELALAGQRWQIHSYIDKGFIAANTRDINSKISLALLVVALVLVPLSLITIRIASRPIVTLRQVTEQLAQGNGDLTHRIEVTNKDDLGQIAANINTFIAQLQQMMLQVASSTQVIDKGVNQLNQHSDSNQLLVDSHTQETEMVVTAITQMSAAAESVSESTAIAANLTQKADQGAHESRQVVNEAIISVTSLAEEVEGMSSVIQDMSRNTDKIGAVLGVIGDIADQTNLLALNAAIEAARAGEQGRGFSVVADEVRALAARTQSSTSEINQMLQELQSGTQSVVEAMAATRVSCQRSAEKTSQVTASLDSMSTEIAEINAQSIQIAASAEEQCKVADEVNRNMVAIQEVVGKISNNGSATAISTQELADSNSRLGEVVSQFSLQKA